MWIQKSNYCFWKTRSHSHEFAHCRRVIIPMLLERHDKGKLQFISIAWAPLVRNFLGDLKTASPSGSTQTAKSHVQGVRWKFLTGQIHRSKPFRLFLTGGRCRCLNEALEMSARYQGQDVHLKFLHIDWERHRFDGWRRSRIWLFIYVLAYCMIS